MNSLIRQVFRYNIYIGFFAKILEHNLWNYKRLVQIFTSVGIFHFVACDKCVCVCWDTIQSLFVITTSRIQRQKLLTSDGNRSMSYTRNMNKWDMMYSPWIYRIRLSLLGLILYASIEWMNECYHYYHICAIKWKIALTILPTRIPWVLCMYERTKSTAHTYIAHHSSIYSKYTMRLTCVMALIIHAFEEFRNIPAKW